jgi:hypothetical protein
MVSGMVVGIPGYSWHRGMRLGAVGEPLSVGGVINVHDITEPTSYVLIKPL